ncbi:hypothetical protein ACT7DH_05755 [Bacillus pacificus]
MNECQIDTWFNRRYFKEVFQIDEETWNRAERDEHFGNWYIT